MTSLTSVTACPRCGYAAFLNFLDLDELHSSGQCSACGYTEKDAKYICGPGVFLFKEKDSDELQTLQDWKPPTCDEAAAMIKRYESEHPEQLIVMATFFNEGTGELTFIRGEPEGEWLPDGFDPTLLQVNVTRPANGITLNAGIQETLLDDQGRPMVFDSEKVARIWLAGQGFSVDEIEMFEFPFAGEDALAVVGS